MTSRALVAVLLLLSACRTAEVPASLEDASTPTATPASTAAPPAAAPATAGVPTDPVSTSPADTDSDASYESVISSGEVDDPRFDPMQADVMARVDAAGLPGASMLVVHHGELVEQEAWGSYTLDTVVPIASASKWLSAATIMTLVDDGTLELDEPISTHLPRTVDTVVGTITLRQLLSFTSGLIDNDRLPASLDPGISLQDEAKLVLAHGVVHPPGAAFRYGGQHLLVAAGLAEIVTGRPFVELFRERIADPLGMDRSWFVQTGDHRLTDVDHPSPAGTAVSSLGDYARFLEMIVNDGLAPSGARVLSLEALAEMQKNHTEDVRYGTAAAFRQAERAPYGLGEWLDWTFPDGTAMVLSSDGKFGFRPWIDRRNDLFGVYLVDNRGATGYSDGDPDAAQDGGKVHVSGNWIFEMVADAVGGDLPADHYPHRR